MNELLKLIELLTLAAEKGQTFTLSADDVAVTVKPSTEGNVGQTVMEIVINNPLISTEA